MKKNTKERVATVHVSLTPYGKAAYRFQKAAQSADLCEHPVGEEAARYRQGSTQCLAMAKFTLEGMKVCGKHASFLLLQAAYKAGLKRRD